MPRHQPFYRIFIPYFELIPREQSSMERKLTPENTAMISIWTNTLLCALIGMQGQPVRSRTQVRHDRQVQGCANNCSCAGLQGIATLWKTQ
jgi:hypothetical protein